MTRQRFFHKKRKNIGLLYEVIVQRITNMILESNDQEFNTLYNMIRKHFNKNSELYKELQFYSTLSECKTKNVEDAQKIYKKILDSAMKVDYIKLNEELNLFLTDIDEYSNNVVKTDLLDNVKIKNYRVFASAQQLLEYHRNEAKYIKSIPKVVLLERNLVDEIYSRSNESKNPSYYEVFGQMQKIDDVSFKTILERFNNRYKTYSSSQKETINNFILSVGGTKKLKDYVIGEYQRLQKVLNESTNKISDDALKIKIKGISDIIQNIVLSKKDIISENSIAILLGVQKLEEDIKNLAESSKPKKENKLLQEVQMGIYYDTIKGSIKSLVQVEGGSPKSPTDVSIGYKFDVKFLPTEEMEKEKYPALHAAKMFRQELLNFVSKEVYKTLLQLNSNGFDVDNHLQKYPDSAIDFRDVSDYNASNIKMKKPYTCFIKGTALVTQDRSIDEIRVIVKKVLSSGNLLNSELFQPRNSVCWEIVK